MKLKLSKHKLWVSAGEEGPLYEDEFGNLYHVNMSPTFAQGEVRVEEDCKHTEYSLLCVNDSGYGFIDVVRFVSSEVS